ncbi:Protein ast2 [Saccharomyces cerevisiae]|nr:ALH_1c_G0015690.mRNA.1.CDS.1 [Saccharomyces cerevisiae]CAI4440514.1 ALH_1b_G0015710.mRNA.1.CDS.1 [Saccharomyces cerevisiae]CAI5282449.1 AKR_HP2_G0015710.mRNA.1.CDS.1 [Saccharomyces cerevisiae]CAI6556462.1 AKR_HP2_G0015710.mRNA.1.CDS.1 [Saccharomyces cerevisiae]CAI6558161.1 AKR_HP1_G0015250.mRNA.1.CDS.1 [Saccharomyces cerevisiae]
MAAKILENKDPKLEAMTVDHEVSAPKPIPVDEPTLTRVARPLRHVRHIPVKSLVFHSKHGPITFSYENKIKLPISKNKLVVQVNYVGLNPVDMKIRNGYTKPIYGEAGIGREYSGVITHVGDNLTNRWNVGDDVYGIYYHPKLAIGALQSSLLIDPRVDPILMRPKNTLSPEKAAGSLFCLGTAFNLLAQLKEKDQLNTESNVLINGGTSSVGMFAIQLLKRYYKVSKKLVVVTSGNGAAVLSEHFPDLKDEIIFINYLSCRGKSSKPLRRMLDTGKVVDYDDFNTLKETEDYTQGKFNVVLDFIGGYDILSHSSSLIHAKGAYITTVGDYVGNYKKDVFDSWDNPSANARKMFGSMLWSYDYSHFYFDPNIKIIPKKNDWIHECGKLLNEGVVDCVVDKVYSWKNFKEAFSYMATQRAQGKLIMKVEGF